MFLGIRRQVQYQIAQSIAPKDLDFTFVLVLLGSVFLPYLVGPELGASLGLLDERRGGRHGGGGSYDPRGAAQHLHDGLEMVVVLAIQADLSNARDGLLYRLEMGGYGGGGVPLRALAPSPHDDDRSQSRPGGQDVGSDGTQSHRVARFGEGRYASRDVIVVRDQGRVGGRIFAVFRRRAVGGGRRVGGSGGIDPDLALDAREPFEDGVENEPQGTQGGVRRGRRRLGGAHG